MAKVNHQGNTLLFFQVICHLSIIPMIGFGSFRHYLIAIGIYFLTGCLGMSMTYHRLLSHRSWKAPRWFERMGSLFGTLGLTGTPIAWCAVHREHHKYSDDGRDPHSPIHQVFYRVQFLSMQHRPKLRYVRDLLKDDFQKFLHRRYLTLNICYSLGLLVFFGPFAVVYAHLFPAAILWNAGSLINTLGHLSGYRRYTTQDSSRNNVLLGVFMWGEGWHNNHHKFPSSPYFGRAWYELDVSGWIISALRLKSLT